MTYDELKNIAETVGERHGWNFGRMRDDRDPVPWDYAEVARRYLQASDTVLDVGTGGGELFLDLATSFAHGVGIDIDSDMLAAARENRDSRNQSNVEFAEMPATALAFANQTFDVVLNRQAPLDAFEIARVLKPGGYCITQQIGATNMHTVIAAFGWDISALPQAQSLQPYIDAFEQAGCTVISRAMYNLRYFVQDVASLVFWLKAILHYSATGFPETFDIERHWPVVSGLITQYQTARGIETNEHRELLIIQKR